MSIADGDNALAARAQVLVRAPVDKTFAAFVDPDVITRFWLSATTGPLETGATVHWSFMVEGAEVDTTVTALVPSSRIAIDWSDGTTLDLQFTPFFDDATVVTVVNAGFSGTSEEVAATAIGATEGFTIVLCDLKVLLETGTSPNLVRHKAELISARF